MIDRRRFVQSMMVLGAAARIRPTTVLLGAAAGGRPARPCRRRARRRAQGGRLYADIRINRYRNQFIFTRDRRVQNIVNTEDYGFGVRVIADGTWGFASSSIVTKDEIATGRGAGGRRSRKANAAINAEPVQLAPVDAYNDVVEHAGHQEPVRDAAPAEARSAAADQRRGAEGAGRELRLRVDAVRERAQVLRVDRGLAHRAVADPLVPVVLGDGGRSRHGQVLLAQFADRADGHGLRIRRDLPAAAGSAGRRRGSGRDAQGEAGARRAEDADPAPDQPAGSPSTSRSATRPSSIARSATRRTSPAPASSPPTSSATFEFGSKLVNIVADKTQEHGMATCGYDDDGVKTTRWPLIKDGVFVDYQTTRDQAHLINQKASHGCSYADNWSSVPFQRMPNVSLQPGDKDLSEQDIIAATDDGDLHQGRRQLQHRPPALQLPVQRPDVLGGQERQDHDRSCATSPTSRTRRSSGSRATCSAAGRPICSGARSATARASPRRATRSAMAARSRGSRASTS